tara:strand:+ start:16510 stop:16662 length:153 start_codon:yes stop_codon:yes gene_type:complete
MEEDTRRLRILRTYIKRQLSRGLEIQGIDVQEIAEWPIEMVLQYFPEEES